MCNYLGIFLNHLYNFGIGFLNVHRALVRFPIWEYKHCNMMRQHHHSPYWLWYDENSQFTKKMCVHGCVKYSCESTIYIGCHSKSRIFFCISSDILQKQTYM